MTLSRGPAMAVNAEKLSFARLNVCGQCSRKRQYQLRRLLLDEYLDILTFQETKFSTEVQTDNALQPFMGDYQVCVSHTVEVSAGCWLFLSNKLALDNISLVSDVNDRYRVCYFVLLSKHWKVICIYAPNNPNEREAFFRDFTVSLQTDKLILMMGDFNCVRSVNDRLPADSYIARSARLLGELDDFDLLDIGKLVLSAG